MKLNTTDYHRMKTAIKAVVDHAGGTQIVKEQGKLVPMQLLWQLFHIACRNLQYDDSHPGFAGNHWTRVVEHDSTFMMYPVGINDDHWATALKKIGKELSII